MKRTPPCWLLWVLRYSLWKFTCGRSASRPRARSIPAEPASVRAALYTVLFLRARARAEERESCTGLFVESDCDAVLLAAGCGAGACGFSCARERECDEAAMNAAASKALSVVLGRR